MACSTTELTVAHPLVPHSARAQRRTKPGPAPLARYRPASTHRHISPLSQSGPLGARSCLSFTSSYRYKCALETLLYNLCSTVPAVPDGRSTPEARWRRRFRPAGDARPPPQHPSNRLHRIYTEVAETLSAEPSTSLPSQKRGSSFPGMLMSVMVRSRGNSQDTLDLVLGKNTHPDASS